MSFADILNPYGYGNGYGYGYAPRQRPAHQHPFYTSSPYGGSRGRAYYQGSDSEDDGPMQYMYGGRPVYKQQPPRGYRQQQRPSYYDDDEDDCNCGHPQCPSTIRARQRQQILEQQRAQQARAAAIAREWEMQQQQQQRRARMMMETDDDTEECNCGRPQCPSTIRARQRLAAAAQQQQQQRQQQQQQRRASPPTAAALTDKTPSNGAVDSELQLEEPTSHKRLTRKQRQRALARLRQAFAARRIQQWWRSIFSDRRAKTLQEAQARAEAEKLERENKAAATLQRFIEKAAAVVPAKRIAAQLAELRKIEAKVSEVESEYAPTTTRSGGMSVYDDRGRVRKDILAYEDGLVKSLLAIDGVLTYGSEIVRNRRKELVRNIETQLADLDAYRSSGEKKDHMEVDSHSN